jgi:curved DNA-binding protein CbpA
MSSNSKPFVDHYEVLELPPLTPTEEEIKNAYKKQALIWHPDKNKSSKK